jgi:hypothetical protein
MRPLRSLLTDTLVSELFRNPTSQAQLPGQDIELVLLHQIHVKNNYTNNKLNKLMKLKVGSMCLI